MRSKKSENKRHLAKNITIIVLDAIAILAIVTLPPMKSVSGVNDLRIFLMLPFFASQLYYVYHTIRLLGRMGDDRNRIRPSDSTGAGPRCVRCKRETQVTVNWLCPDCRTVIYGQSRRK